MENKVVLWIIGGNSTGKTTCARKIHEYFREIAEIQHNPAILFKENQIKYTFYSNLSCNLGDLTKSQCGGTDTLGKKDVIIATYNKAIQKYPIVVIEGIMATGQWIEFIKFKPEIKVFLLLLNMTPEANFNRLKQRKGIKSSKPTTEILLTQKTMDNLSGKLRGFQSLFNRMQPFVDDSLQLDVDDLSISQVWSQVLPRLTNFIIHI